MCFFLLLSHLYLLNPYEQDKCERACHPDEEANDDLRKCMLAQYHAACSHDARHYQYSAHWHQRIKEEEITECDDCAKESAHTCHVGTYFPPCIDQGAYKANDKHGKNHATHEQGCIYLHEDEHTCNVACNCYEVGHVSVFPVAELPV